MKKNWTHPKYKTTFQGTYAKSSKDSFSFVLTDGKKQISFDSFWAAKRAGWKTV